MIVSDVNEQTLKEMDVLVGEGVTSFKMFMAYPGVFYATDGEILQAMQRAAGNGATIMMHAENGIAIDVLVAQALAAGHTDPGWHGRTRPPELEGEATSRAIRLAQVTGAPLYIVHLSARQALDAVTEARDRGAQRVRRDLPAVPVPVPGRPGRAGVRGREVRLLAAGPPKEHWAAHVARACAPTTCPSCPPTTARSASRSRRSWAAATSPRSRTACPGIEHRIDLLHQGVVDGELSLGPVGRGELDHPGPDVRPLPAQGHDRPRLGRRHRASTTRPRGTCCPRQTHHMAVDYSAYEGREVQGQVTTVMSRGEIILSRRRVARAGRAGAGSCPAAICQYLG